jgi:chromosome partitioning protein
VLIDCPPSLGLLTINALVAAEEVLVPLQCEFFAMEGISQLTRTMKLVQGYLNEDLRMGGIILTMFDGRTNLSKEVEGEIRKSYGSKVFRTVVPRNIRLSEAPSYGMPVRYYEPSCPGALAYDDLAEEVITQWLEKEL